MKVLANDGLEKTGVRKFEQAGIWIDIGKREDLIGVIAEYDGLIVRSATKVTKEIIEAGKDSLRIIGRAGVGYDNVDVEAACEYGIVVKFAPHGNTTSTAELALGLMFDVSRNIAQARYLLKQGIWDKKNGTELSGKTLGIIGCGRIGQELSQLVSGLCMKVIGYDVYEYPESRIEYMEKEDVLRQADYISIHTGGKIEIIGEKELALMKETAFLINASRGDNVNEDALYKALTQGKIAGAGLDSYQNEPKKRGQEFPESMKRLISLENVVPTPHIGASTSEAQVKTGVEMAEVVIKYLLEGDKTNAVNIEEEIAVEEKPTYPLVISYKYGSGMFAQFDKIFGDHNINIRKIDEAKLTDTENAAATYLVEQKPGAEVLEALRKIPDVYSVKGD